MVNASKVLKARKSKRQTLHDKHKIAKKIREHLRKTRRDQKRNPTKYARKDPGIPNSWPFKAQLLEQQERKREELKLEAEAMREAKIRERQMAKQAEAALAAAARMTAQQRREAKRRKAAFAPLQDVMADADVVLMVLDARDPTACRSVALEQALIECGKLPILVINKTDLVPRDAVDGWMESLSEHAPVVPFSVGQPAASSAAAVAKPPPKPKHKFKKSRAELKAEAEAAKAAAAAAASSGGGEARVVGLEQLGAVLAARRAALAGPTELPGKKRGRGAETPAAPLPDLTVGIVGFDRVGKRSLLRAARGAAFEGVAWLPLPAVLSPVTGSSQLNAVLMRKFPGEYVTQPELVVGELLERAERRSVLKHFRASDFDEASGFLASFAAAHNLPLPKPAAGGSVDARAAAVGFLKHVSSGQMPFYTPAPPAPPGGSSLPASLVGAGWRVKGEVTAADDADGLVMVAGVAEEIDLEEAEEWDANDGDGSDDEGEDEEEGEEEGEEGDASEEVSATDDDDDDDEAE